MPFLILVGACLMLALGYVTLAVHYAEEAGFIHLGRSVEAQAATTQGEPIHELSITLPLQESAPKADLNSPQGAVELFLTETPSSPSAQILTTPHRTADHAGQSGDRKKGRKRDKQPGAPRASRKFKAGQRVTDGDDTSCNSDKGSLSLTQP